MISELDFQSDPDLEKARIGVEAVHFMSTAVGKKMLEKAALELREAQIRLETATTDEIKELQARAYRARSFIQWLQQIVKEGKSAEENIANEESYE